MMAGESAIGGKGQSGGKVGAARQPVKVLWEEHIKANYDFELVKFCGSYKEELKRRRDDAPAHADRVEAAFESNDAVECWSVTWDGNELNRND